MKRLIVCALALFILFSCPLAAGAAQETPPASTLTADLPDGFSGAADPGDPSLWAVNEDGSAKIFLDTAFSSGAMFEVGLGGYEMDFVEMTRAEFDQVVSDMYTAPHYFDVLRAGEYMGQGLFVYAEAVSGNQSFLYYRTLKNGNFYSITYQVTDRALTDDDRAAAMLVADTLIIPKDGFSYAASIIVPEGAPARADAAVDFTLPETSCQLLIPGNFYGVDRTSLPEGETEQANELLKKMQKLMPNLDMYYYALGVMDSGRAVQMAVSSSDFNQNTANFMQIGQLNLTNDFNKITTQGTETDYGLLETDAVSFRKTLLSPRSDSRYYCMVYAADNGLASILFTWDQTESPDDADIAAADKIVASASFFGPGLGDANGSTGKSAGISRQGGQTKETFDLQMFPLIIALCSVAAVILAVWIVYTRNRRSIDLGPQPTEQERIMRLIKRLDALRRRFILTDEEFEQKRDELLRRTTRM